jgi:hypothetical protein
VLDNKKTALIKRLSIIFARLNYKISFNLKNTSSYLLPTDLLRDNVKRRLYKIVSLRVENVMLNLFSNDIDSLEDRTEEIFYFILKGSAEEMLNFYYGGDFAINTAVFEKSFYIKTLAKESKLLFFIPFSALDKVNSKTFRSVFSPVYNFAYDSFIEALVDNLVVEICNCVTYYIVNEFSYLSDVRKSLFRSNFLSLRNLERFKNNLNWQSRVKAFVNYPASIYNNEYGIWVVRTTGIYYRIIYANRSKELGSLNNLPLVTLLTIETKDFLSSRVDELVYNLGSGLRFTFTSVIGQFVGLVWRGIIEGLKK